VEFSIASTIGPCSCAHTWLAPCGRRAHVALATRGTQSAFKIWFPGKTVWVKFIGTHETYDRLDVRNL
jgi:hypothetical protein